MKTRKISSFLIILCLLSIFIGLKASYGYTLLSGISVFEGNQGVTIFEVRPGTPANNAGIKKGDVILELDKKKIKTIDNYVNFSKSLPKNKHEIVVLVKRAKENITFRLEDYSIPIKNYWGLKIPVSKKKPPKNIRPHDYWVNEHKRLLSSIKKNTPHKTQIAIYHKAINSLFYALHHKPEMVEDMVLIADLFKKIGEVSINNTPKKDSVNNFKIAIKLYKKSMSKRQLPKEILIKIRENLMNIENLLKQ